MGDRTALNDGLTHDDLRRRSSDALAIAQRDPDRATAVASEVLPAAMAVGDAASASIAARAIGLAAREHHDLTTSTRELRRAVRLAEGGELPALAGEARLSLAGTLALRGDWQDALKEADLAEGVLRGIDLARLHAQRGYILRMHGRLDEAMLNFKRALPVLRRHGDHIWQARLHSNRGLAHYQLGDLAAAEADLRQAIELYLALDQGRMAASARQNLGMVLGLRGDIPTALACFDDADSWFAQRGQIDAMGLNDRCLVLLAARLVSEARECAQSAVEALAREGRLAYLAQAQLKLAEAALLAGDWEVARRTAETARAAFARQRRPAWSALAEHVVVRATWAQGELSPALLRAAQRAADDLARAGFSLAALDVRLLAAELACQIGQLRTARRQLGLASAARERGPAQLRARAWHAEAMLRLADGNRRGAKRALDAGMAVLERYRLALGATELRVHASAHGTDLARTGLKLAIEDGRADQVLLWAERWRAGALRLRPARPPDDRRLAADLEELRSVVAATDRAVLDGRSTTGLVARQAALEEAVRSRARHARGVLDSSQPVPPSVATLAAALGEWALVELVEHDGVLQAVVLADGRARVHPLAPSTTVAAEVDQVRSSLRRLASGTRSSASVAAFRDAASFGASRLDDILLSPLRGALADHPLVIVPTGGLHAVPWSTLPSIGGRPVTVAPSAALWHRALTGPVGQGGVTVLVAGPGLPGAAAEIEALARRYPGARTLTNERARCTEVSATLDGAHLAHIAAHGRFRSDNPLFSCLELVDGPLTVYDLEALRRPPPTLVLSACESGSSAVRPGDELMGLTAALLALGTCTVVSSVFPVPDDATQWLMLALHEGLHAGLGPAEALADAQARSSDAGPKGHAAAAAFVCFGAGRDLTRGAW